MNLPKKTHQKQNQRHKLHIIHVSDKTKQIKKKTKNNSNKKRATKKWHAKPSTIKATSPPHFKKKSRDRSTKITVSLCFDVFNRIKF